MAGLLSPLWESRVHTLGQNGFSVECGPATFTTTATSETIKTHMTRVLGVFLFPSAAPAAGEELYWDQGDTTNGWYTPTAGTITVKRSLSSTFFNVQAGNFASNTNGSINALAPATGSISAAKVVSTSADAADSDTDYRTFGILNKTQTLAPVAAATAANTTALTGGVAVVAYTARALTLAAAAQLLVTQGDVLEFAVSDSGTGVELLGVSFQVTITPSSVTSGLAFNYLIIGQQG